MKVYNVFVIRGDGDSNISLSLLATCATLDVALSFSKKQTTVHGYKLSEMGFELTHDSMNEENNYTFIGKEEDLTPYCEYCYFGGFLITEVDVIV